MEVVISNIQSMREQMLTYVKQDQMDKKIEKIQNIIEPEKFIEKHFEQSDPKFLFEKVLKESPQNKVASRTDLNTDLPFDIPASPKKVDFWDNEVDSPSQPEFYHN